jgi:serine/threonine protein kinase
MAQGSTPYVRRESSLGLGEQTGERTTPRVGGYRVLRRLATGGTCDVLLAKAEGPHGFGRLVVLKLLLSKFSGEEQFARMFAREAAAYARLDHPAIVRLYDFFSLDGQLVMVLEFVDGLTLARLVTLARAGSVEIPDAVILYLGQRIFSAVAAAHSAKDLDTGAIAPVIHRDVNPTNVLIPWEGHAKITDFGIAKVAGVTSDTQTGLIKGTYGYMAPEQVKGEVVTVRADVYAAAIVMWELFAKKPAMMRDELPEMELLRAMAEPRIASLDALRPDLDRRVRDLMRVALEPDARKRLISAHEIVSVLRAVSPSDDGREQLVALMNRIRPSPDRSASPTPFVGQQHHAAVAAAIKSAQQPSPTGDAGAKLGATAVMPERPPLLPKLTPPPRTASTPGMNAIVVADASPPVPPMRAKVQSVGTMSQALDAAVAAAIDVGGAELAPTARDPSTNVSTVPPPPDTVIDTPSVAIRGDEPTANMQSPALASLLEPMLGDPVIAPILGPNIPAPPPFGTTSSAPPGATAPTSPPMSETIPAPARTNEEPDHPAHGNDHTVAMGGARFGQATAAMGVVHPPPHDGSTMPPALPPMRPRQVTQPSINRLAAQKKSSFGALIALGVGVGMLGGLGAAAFHYRAPLMQAYLSSPAPSASASEPTATWPAIKSPAVSESSSSQASPSASAPPPTAASASASAAAPASASALPSESAAPSASASASASAAPAAPASAAPSASAPASPPASASASPSSSPTAAEISTEAASPHHRIFVDDRVVGETPSTVTVACGKHTVKIGSSGKPQDVDIPCGTRKVIGDK